MNVTFSVRWGVSFGLLLLGMLVCLPTGAVHSAPSRIDRLAMAVTPTIDGTATAAAATIEAALNTTPQATTTTTPTVDATKTSAAQRLATAVAATRTAQAVTTAAAATATRAAVQIATDVAATLTAQPTVTPTATPTPNLAATTTAQAAEVATKVAATLTAQAPPPTPTIFISPVSENADATLRIAFAHGDIGDSDLRVADAETGAVQIVAGQACDEAEPSWSPDGAQIVYHADCAESYDLYRVNRDGAGGVRLTFTPDRDEREPEYAPDGSQIIYRVNPRKEANTNAVGELWLMDANGNNPRALGLTGRAPAWSPDGRTLAFMSDRTGRWNIYLYEIASGRTTQLTNCDTNCRWPAWSPDGQTLVFNTTTKANNTQAEALWLIPASGGQPTRLVSGRNPGRASWSQSGLLIFNSADGIEYVRTDGRERTLLIPDNLNWAPHWSR